MHMLYIQTSLTASSTVAHLQPASSITGISHLPVGHVLSICLFIYLFIYSVDLRVYVTLPYAVDSFIISFLHERCYINSANSRDYFQFLFLLIHVRLLFLTAARVSCIRFVLL